MKPPKLMVTGLIVSTLATCFGYSTSASAQYANNHYPNCNNYYYVGKAVTGQNVHVDLCSIHPHSKQHVNFTYYLGKERIQARANCTQRTWVVYPERVTYKARSSGTANMMREVCNQNGPSIQSVD